MRWADSREWVRRIARRRLGWIGRRLARYLAEGSIRGKGRPPRSSPRRPPRGGDHHGCTPTSRPRRKPSDAARTSRPSSTSCTTTCASRRQRAEKRARPARPETRSHQQEGRQFRRRPAADRPAAGRAPPADRPGPTRRCADQLQALHRIARLTPDEARHLLLQRVEEDLRGEVGGMILKHQAAIRRSRSAKKPARS